MISELNDDEILDFLMTSDMEGDYSPVELKYLLNKWRYFYRILHGNSNRDKIHLEGLNTQLREENKDKDLENVKLLMKIAKGEDTIHSMKNRKLTFKERWQGKIITKENED